MYHFQKLIFLILLSGLFGITNISFSYGFSDYLLSCDLRGKAIHASQRSSQKRFDRYDKAYATIQSHQFHNYSMRFVERNLFSSDYRLGVRNKVTWSYYDGSVELKYTYFSNTNKINLTIGKPGSAGSYDKWGDCNKSYVEAKNTNSQSVWFKDFDDEVLCFNATKTYDNRKVWNLSNEGHVKEAKSRGLKCGVNEDDIIVVSKAKKSKEIGVSSKLEKEIAKRLEEERKRKSLEKEIAELRQKNRELQLPKKIKQKPSYEIGSGFYVSKFRHIVTNQHVVNKCKKITVGDSMNSQIPADLIASDKRNDLAILQTVSMEMASADTKSFVQKLAVQIVPIISGGLIRSEDVRGGEEILVAGYPLGDMVSDTIKVTRGIVSATKGIDNDVSLFEIDAVIRKGNSGGPIYDKRGNIVGIAVSRLNVNRTDTVNFGIKGSTIKQFLSAHDIPTKWSNRNKVVGNEKLYQIASKQTVMVVCHK